MAGVDTAEMNSLHGGNASDLFLGSCEFMSRLLTSIGATRVLKSDTFHSEGTVAKIDFCDSTALEFPNWMSCSHLEHLRRRAVGVLKKHLEPLIFLLLYASANSIIFSEAFTPFGVDTLMLADTRFLSQYDSATRYAIMCSFPLSLNLTAAGVSLPVRSPSITFLPALAPRPRYRTEGIVQHASDSASYVVFRASGVSSDATAKSHSPRRHLSFPKAFRYLPESSLAICRPERTGACTIDQSIRFCCAVAKKTASRSIRRAEQPQPVSSPHAALVIIILSGSASTLDCAVLLLLDLIVPRRAFAMFGYYNLPRVRERSQRHLTFSLWREHLPSGLLT
ncbi:hypothetical protein NM688_g6092 [Phlebia brevispora]|uniref:Uncharacterized protein n=1 Tax=Phlebia brevispora TaxID=194682 RepID=A0ACC1SK32_9APHY|nr:hypothetical protein NM688_g6092 [Phlebia brevispora]